MLIKVANVADSKPSAAGFDRGTEPSLPSSAGALAPEADSWRSQRNVRFGPLHPLTPHTLSSFIPPQSNTAHTISSTRTKTAGNNSFTEQSTLRFELEAHHPIFLFRRAHCKRRDGKNSAMQMDEAARLRALRDLNLLDTAPSESFDRITRMASQLFKAPLAAVSLTDEKRQWFKSRVGCGPEIPRDKAPCAEVTRTGGVLVVPDLAADSRFDGGILVRNGVRFYAGAPLVTREGFTLGSMCVLDMEPRTVSDDEVKMLSDLAAMVMAQVELEHSLGRIDPASGLPNRNQFGEDLQDMNLDHAGEERVAILIDLADPAHLAQAMRVLGPTCLDELIRTSVDAIKQHLDTGATLYHVGTKQFATLFAGQAEESIRGKIGAQLTALQASIRALGFAATSGVAVGIAPFRLGDAVAGDVLRAAHSAAQDARDSGAAVGVYSPSIDALHQRRFAILGGLREALAATDQLSLAYQPVIDLRSGRCRGAEALLRWRHPTLGIIAPGEFIPLAEQTDLAKPLTEWVVNAALAQLATWHRAGVELHVSANVSAVNLEEEDFPDRLMASLQRHAVVAQKFQIEFTEGALITNQARILRNLGIIRQAGVSCAIDDFGTGYSSFSYLRDIPADTVKIDQSFIRGMRPGTRGSALVRNIINMARELGYRVVAEGVETQEAYDFLVGVSCDYAQGYLIARPMPPEKFLHWLRDRHAWFGPGGATLLADMPTF